MECRKNGTDEPICRAGLEMQAWSTDLGKQQEKEKVGWLERAVLKHTHYHEQCSWPAGRRFMTHGAHVL